MPNETWNKLFIEGPEPDVQRFIDRVVSTELDYQNEPWVLDFEGHVPVPPEIRKSTEQDGSPDMHFWVMERWGCKQPMSAEIIERDVGRVVYFLITPVEVPIPWLEATARAEPTLAFELEYVFEFDDIGHRVRYEAGELVGEAVVELSDIEWVTLNDEDE